jgi:hypothetical protein
VSQLPSYTMRRVSSEVELPPPVDAYMSPPLPSTWYRKVAHPLMHQLFPPSSRHVSGFVLGWCAPVLSPCTVVKGAGTQSARRQSQVCQMSLGVGEVVPCFDSYLASPSRPALSRPRPLSPAGLDRVSCGTCRPSTKMPEATRRKRAFILFELRRMTAGRCVHVQGKPRRDLAFGGGSAHGGGRKHTGPHNPFLACRSALASLFGSTSPVVVCSRLRRRRGQVSLYKR